CSVERDRWRRGACVAAIAALIVACFGRWYVDGMRLPIGIWKVVVGTFPWSCLAIPVALTAWRRGRGESTTRPLVAAGIAWFCLPIGFHLSSPNGTSLLLGFGFPAFALLCGAYVARTIRGQLDCPRWMLISLALALTVGIGFGTLVGTWLPEHLPHARPLA